MGRKKLIAAVCAVFLAALIAVVLHLSQYVIVGSRFYPKDSRFLNLHGEDISLAHYTQLRRKLPEADIRWDVPFQGGSLSDDSTDLTITQLSIEDADLLITYLPKLRTIHAESCTDYDALLYLREKRPDIQVDYRVPLNGRNYSATAIRLTLSGITEAELELLPCLPLLKAVTVTGGDLEMLTRLQEYCAENNISFFTQIGKDVLPGDTESLQVQGITNEALPLLYLLPNLKTLHLTEPEADADKLLALVDDLPGTAVTWEKTVLGLTFSQDATEIDLTSIIALGDGEVLGDKTAYQYGVDYPVLGTKEEVPSAVKVLEYHPLPNKEGITKDLIAEAEAAMAYFPKAEKLVMCGSILDNEAMAAFRESHRDSYKVVWTVQCGDVAPRTDATLFMPTKYHVYYFFDKDTPNLKYCEDIVAMDIGHMLVRDLSFVEYMPNLKYLILTLSDVREITPLSSCKNLVFLEMDWTRVTDYSPLLECTALEDLNIGETYGDITPVCQMTWLKNLWLVGCGNKKIWAATEALPNTHIGAFYDNPDDGWRQLPNYFKMRDALLMYYML